MKSKLKTAICLVLSLLIMTSAITTASPFSIANTASAIGGSGTYTNHQEMNTDDVVHVGASIKMNNAVSGTDFASISDTTSYTRYDWDEGTRRLEGTYQLDDSASALYYVDRYEHKDMSSLGNIVNLTYFTTGKAHRHNIYLTDISTHHAHGSSLSAKIKTTNGKEITYSLSAGPALLSSSIDDDYNSNEAMQRSYDLAITGAVPDAGDSVSFRVSASALAKGYDDAYYFHYLWTNVTVKVVDSTLLHEEMSKTTGDSKIFSNYYIYQNALNKANSVLSSASPTQQELDEAARSLKSARESLKKTMTLGGDKSAVNGQVFLEENNVRIMSEITMSKANTVKSFVRDFDSPINFSQKTWDGNVFWGTFQENDSSQATYYIDKYSGINNLAALGDIVKFHFCTDGRRHRHNVYLTEPGTFNPHGRTNSVTVKSSLGYEYTYSLSCPSALITENVDVDFENNGAVDKTYTASISGALPAVGESVSFRVATSPLSYGYNYDSYYFLFSWINITLISVDSTQLHKEINTKPQFSSICYSNYDQYQKAVDDALDVLAEEIPSQQKFDLAAAKVKAARNALVKNGITIGGELKANNVSQYSEKGVVKLQSGIVINNVNDAKNFTSPIYPWASRYWSPDGTVFSGTYQYSDDANAVMYLDKYAVKDMSDLGEFITFRFLTDGVAHRHNVFLDTVGSGSPHGKGNTVTLTSENGEALTYSLTCPSALSANDIHTDFESAGVYKTTKSAGIIGALPNAGDSVTFRVCTDPLAKSYGTYKYYFLYSWINLKIIAVDTTSLRAEMADIPENVFSLDSGNSDYDIAMQKAQEVIGNQKSSQKDIDEALKALKKAKAESSSSDVSCTEFKEEQSDIFSCFILAIKKLLTVLSNIIAGIKA